MIDVWGFDDAKNGLLQRNGVKRDRCFDAARVYLQRKTRLDV